MKGWWWKITGVLLLVYVFVFGLIGEIPRLPILEQSIRNLYFHVPMWFVMMLIMFMSMIFSILYLAKSNTEHDIEGKREQSEIVNSILKHQKFDILAAEWAKVGFVLGILGLITGSVWARSTWGAWWVFEEVKLNAAAAGILVYAAYFILRGSVEDEDRRARIAAVYNIFAFIMFIVLINVIPRVVESSLHPGNGGNPGFSSYDLDNNMRIIFYPAVIGWFLLVGWIIDLAVRLKKIEKRKNLSD
ncbi:MAG: cytochrome c biogenesis protein CcsA [Bacteroidetes bacterium]|nr:cytochrome c biogenesis protein CcsA [Bacteroidota bacterium]